MFNNHSRRQFLKVSGGLLVGATAAGSFPLFRTLASDRTGGITLKFRFILKDRKGNGSFNLQVSPLIRPVILQGLFGQPEYFYPDAVSNFSLSVLAGNERLSLKNQKAGWKVIAGGTYENFQRIGAEIPALKRGGVLSGVNYPAGCITGTDKICSLTVAVAYLGSLPELPLLSTNPKDYVVFGFDRLDSQGNPAVRIDAKKSRVTILDSDNDD